MRGPIHLKKTPDRPVASAHASRFSTGAQRRTCLLHKLGLGSSSFQGSRLRDGPISGVSCCWLPPRPPGHQAGAALPRPDRVTSDRGDGVDDFLDGNASSEKSVTTSAFFSATSLGFLHVGAGRGVVISGSAIGMLSLKGWTYGKLERTSPLQNCSARKRWRVARLA